MEDLGRELNIAPEFFEDLKRDSVPNDRTIWAILNWFNTQIGRTIYSLTRYNFEARARLKDMPCEEGVSIPKYLGNVLVAYSFGNDMITQEDIDDLIKFSNTLREE